MKISDFQPMIPNPHNFSRRHIRAAVVRLGYTKSEAYADRFAGELIAAGLESGEIEPLFFTAKRGRAYGFTD